MHTSPLRTIGHGLMLVAAMLALIAAALWFRPPSAQQAAYARAIGTNDRGLGIPDAGRQRLQMIQELENLNTRLGRIEQGLKTGAFRIEVVPAEGTDAAVGGATGK